MSSRLTNLILLAMCLGLAGTLAFTVWMLKNRPATLESVANPLVVTNTVTQTQIAVRKINASNLLAAMANRPLSWASLESTNYLMFIANLRSFGCPEETVRDIILTDVAKQFARRRAALRVNETYKYWEAEESWDHSYGSNPEIRQQLAELDREQNTLIRTLLGVDFQSEVSKYFSDGVDYQQRQFGFLEGEKRDQVVALHQKYTDLEQAIYARSKGVILPEDELELRRLRKAKEQELAATLSPEELENYQVRNSETAARLRAQLTGFAPNEDEFRKLFRLQKQFDDTFGDGFDPTNPDSAQAKLGAQEAAANALNEEMKKTLGEQRFNEFTRFQDDDYRRLVQLADRLELPKDLAGRVYDMRRDAEVQKQRLETNPNLTAEQRQRALLAIAQEAEKALSQVLPPQALTAYRSSGATWLNDLRVPQNLVPEPEVEPQDATVPPLPPGFPVFPSRTPQ